MPLSSGTSLGAYEILAPLGAGGMGEVYRARDPRLGREVALKIVPEGFAEDPERLARFDREARTLASLHHPNIASLFGFEESGSRRFLVMELVEGSDLAQRLARGPIPVDESIEIARQIAEGLEAAHEKGIVHRDLKPANLKITPEGRVKILDFGLARAYLGDAGDGSSQEIMNSPTLTAGMTRQGTILGTAAYMSPEQARGKVVDRRADLWAFGVILFEMLSGKRLFDGETISDVLAGVLKNTPDWDALPREVPRGVRRLLERCLAKDPKRRLRSAGDALLDLESAEPESAAAPAAAVLPAPARLRWREAVAWIFVAGLAVVLVARALGAWGGSPEAPAARGAHLEIALPKGERNTPFTPPAISPDGRWIVFGTSDSTNRRRLWLRSMGSFVSELLPETAEASFPFWSPDSRSIAYFQRGTLRRMEIASRASTIICECAGLANGPRGGAWTADGTILFAPTANSGIHSIPATGGKEVEITQVDPKLPDGSHRFPFPLPDGERFLFLVWSNNAEALRTHGGIYLASLKGGPVRRVLADVSSPVLVPSGFLLVRRSDQLAAVPFDLRAATGGAGSISIDTEEMFDANMGILTASASLAGDIAYSTGASAIPSSPVWLDLQGRATAITGPTALFTDPVLSPDGKRYAVVRTEGTQATQIWIGDAERGTLVPLTRAINDSYAPVWSPDGSRIAFVNRDTGDDDIYVQSVVATAPRELVHRATIHDTVLNQWSSDGRYLLFSYGPQTGGAAHFEIWVHDFQEGKARSILIEDFPQHDPELSPDGRWLAYTSEESGRPQIYVRSFPGLDRKWLISPQAGTAAHWRRDSREIWYVEPGAEGARAMSVPIQVIGDEIIPGAPKALLTFPSRIGVAAPDGGHTRWLALREAEEESPSSLRVIVNWSPGPSR